MNTKKFLFTFLDVIIVIVACYWCSTFRQLLTVQYSSITLTHCLKEIILYLLRVLAYLLYLQYFQSFFTVKCVKRNSSKKSISYSYCSTQYRFG